MDVTQQLRKVFEVEKQLRGLKSRLHGAEKFLADQDKGLAALGSERTALETQCKQQQAAGANHEGEIKRLDARMAKIREQMDNVKTNKEYKAFLTELNTFKADRDRNEAAALEAMGKVEELKKKIADLDAKRDEREKMRTVAVGDRDARHGEIASRLSELQHQRKELSHGISQDLLKEFERLVHLRGEEAMGAVEVVDARRMEYHCSVCMMGIPVDKVVVLMKGEQPTKCTSCQCFLYLDEESAKLIAPPAKTPRAAKEKVAKVAKETGKAAPLGDGEVAKEKAIKQKAAKDRAAKEKVAKQALAASGAQDAAGKDAQG